MALILGTSLACKQSTAGLVSDSPRTIRTTTEMVDLSFRQLELFAQGMKGPVRRDRTTHQLVEGLSQHHG
jgi:hypothetical protein